MAERKRQVIGKGITRPVAFIEDGPGTLFPMAAANMLLRDATRKANRRLNGECLNERSPAHQSGAVWDGLLLEDGDSSGLKSHASKIRLSSRKQLHIVTKSRK
jgi:hypothetical protein